MDIPWLSIFSFIVSFFLTKKKTKSTAAALGVGAAVGLGTYYLADPSNPDNLFKIGVDSTRTAQDGADTIKAGSQTNSTTSTIGDIAGKTIDTTGKVLTSWGATGTAAVIGTAAVASSSKTRSYLPWIVGGIALILLTRS